MKKREHITRVLVRGTVALLAAVMLTGCGKAKLPEGFEEAAVKEMAEQSIELFNARDYEALWEMGSDELKESITAEQFAQACDPYLDKCGAFEEISKSVVMGGTDKNAGIDYAGAVMVGDYEDGKIQFTVAFDQNMEMIQFLIK
ncbi:MAG: DUF3887 domain-containing protein [Blautia sp.]|nr:DUF3887 domain-containing protein [Blautia sp.]